jgi:UDP-glucose 4-epimerase
LPVLRGVDAVVHLAGRAHVTGDSGDQSRDLYQRDNVGVTRRLALDAARAGVRRFVFVSSIGVNGAATDNEPFRESDPPRPDNAYARSKLEAEQVLRQLAGETAIELVVVRPPLIYGPGAKGNLLRMLRLVASRVPLPLRSLRNRRNLVGLDNACDALALCLKSPRAVGQTFLLAEPEPRSTPQIFAALYAGMGLRNRLFPFPVRLLRTTAQIAGMGAVFDKLGSSLEVDPSNAIRTLSWSPACSFSEGMTQTAAWYVRTRATA